jgi:DNA polymerase-3 subunit gamma/tau
MLGTVDLSFVYRLLDAVAEQDAGAALATVEAMSEHAPDYRGTLDEFASLLHRVAVAQAVPDAVDNSFGDAVQISELARRLTAEDVQLFYQLAVTGKRDLGLAPDARSGMEMTLLRMVAFRPAGVIEESTGLLELKERGPEVAAPAKKPRSVPPQQTKAETVAPEPAAPEPAAPEPAAPEPAAPEPAAPEPAAPELAAPEPAASEPAASEPAPAGGTQGHLAQDRLPQDCLPQDRLALEPARWPDLLDRLGLTGLVYNVASHCELRQVDGERVYFTLDEANASLYNNAHKQRLAAALGNYFEVQFVVEIEPGSPRYETPAQRARRLLEERQAEALESIESDPKVQLLLERFEGSIDRDSVTPIKH